jgi:hypothetical protein
MKNINYKVFAVIIAAVLLHSCKSYLDVVPDNVATIDYAFRDRTSAEKFLFTCYSYTPAIGNPANDPAIMSSDEWWAHEDNYYYKFVGNFDAFNIKRNRQNVGDPLLNYWQGLRNGADLYQGIRDCNIFLENIHKVGPDLNPAERARWIAEVKFLKAYFHYYLLRMYGPIPLIKENLPIDAEHAEIRLYRDKFDDCVNYIVQQIDEAVKDLPLIINDITNELGRITAPVALAVKAELLTMAASPLFNGNPEYAGIVDNRGEHIFTQTEDRNKWVIAATACRNAIDTCTLAGNIRLYRFNDARYTPFMSDTTKLVMSLRHVAADRWNSEIIWGNSRASATDNLQRITIPYFLATMASSANDTYQPFLVPTLRMAELFYSNRGVPLDEDTGYDYAGRYETEQAPADHKYYVQTGYTTARLHLNREPRFYANIGFDGGYWFGNGRTKDVGFGTAAEESWLIRTKAGEPQGKTGGMRFSLTGYWAKKPGHFETTSPTTTGSQTFFRYAFPIIRLSDLYLLYAETLNESLPDANSAPTAEVYRYVDSIRLRAGLEGVVASWQKYSRYPSRPNTRDEMRKIIRQERMIELAFEGKRFWDLRRWKLMQDEMNKPVRTWNIDSETAAEFYNVIVLWPLEFSSKEYLWPIGQQEIRANFNIRQNPGW